MLFLPGCRTQPKQTLTQRSAPSVDSVSSVQPASYQDLNSGPAAEMKLAPLPKPAEEPDSSPARSAESELSELSVPEEVGASTEEIGPETIATPQAVPLALNEVVASIRSHFPLIFQAAAARGIASGEALSARGAFDHKLEGFSELQPLDFYENYRYSLGVKRDTEWGGQTFAGYRLGRGIYEPWYLERETNKGGEFKAGFVAPIVRDRWIDANRAALWQAQLERRRVEPEILAQIIMFVRDGSVAYWKWVAAGEVYRINRRLLGLAEFRKEGLQEQVRVEEKARIDLVDNRRIIVSREAKLIDARRKLEQAGVKLSLFYRTDVGQSRLPENAQLPPQFSDLFAKPEQNFRLSEEADDIGLALAQRPELSELRIKRQQLNVALRQACNEMLPDIDAGVLVGQDVGEPTSSTRDKSEFELEAMATLTVPLERRKARGKVRSLRAKIAQLQAKNRFQSDKITADVRLARAALLAAQERVTRASESYELAQQMRVAEQDLFDAGQSSLFNLNIREIQAAEAEIARAEALLEFFAAQADYAAALGFDGPML